MERAKSAAELFVSSRWSMAVAQPRAIVRVSA
jgi:hypothetical protein